MLRSLRRLPLLPSWLYCSSNSRTLSRSSASKNDFFRVSEEVEDAIQTGQPVVALETTIYTHGFPYPQNVALCSRLESLVRENGGIPATIGVLNGVARVGFEPTELTELLASAGQKDTLKISRRDLAYICGLGMGGRRINGGTTVAGTMVLAHLAGIKVFATGGLGGVHKGGELSMDISADLTELGRTPVAVISSGCKSFLDIPRTLEYLETQGVGVCTFADGRKGRVDFPAFWTRNSGTLSPAVVQDEKEAAAIIHAQTSLPISSGLLFANPIPKEYSLPKAEMDKMMDEAIQLAKEGGVSGNAETPFILAKIRELSESTTTNANTKLVEANVERGTKVAVALATLQNVKRAVLQRVQPIVVAQDYLLPAATLTPAASVLSGSQEPLRYPPLDVVVAGSVAIDTSCDYNPDKLGEIVPRNPSMKTSNPAIISQNLGGVGQNIATALHYMKTKVLFCSVVADDANGKAALSMLADQGLNTDGIEIQTYEDVGTARYIAFNDSKKNLIIAMADMRVLENHGHHHWMGNLQSCKPKFLILDANWSRASLHQWRNAGRMAGAKVAFEPVSVEKSCRIFDNRNQNILDPEPSQLADLVTPNEAELHAMHKYIYDGKSRQPWRQFVDSLVLSKKLAAMLSSPMLALKDHHMNIVRNSVELLLYFPCILTKMGSRGVLLTELLQKHDPRISAEWAQDYLLHIPEVVSSNSIYDSVYRGGKQSHTSQYLRNYSAVYVRKNPPAEKIKREELVSVNGVGDTFLSIIVAGLTKEKPKILDELVMVAQKGACMTLKTKESVSPEISSLQFLL